MATLNFLACIAGAKLFALSKAPKKGVCPIVVTDTVHALVGKALYTKYGHQQNLANYFTNSHPRVMQMGVCLHNGASIMQHLISVLLAAQPSHSGVKYQRAVISVDAKNALMRPLKQSSLRLLTIIESNMEPISFLLLSRVTQELHIAWVQAGATSPSDPSALLLNHFVPVWQALQSEDKPLHTPSHLCPCSCHSHLRYLQSHSLHFSYQCISHLCYLHQHLCLWIGLRNLLPWTCLTALATGVRPSPVSWMALLFWSLSSPTHCSLHLLFHSKLKSNLFTLSPSSFKLCYKLT